MMRICFVFSCYVLRSPKPVRVFWHLIPFVLRETLPGCRATEMVRGLKFRIKEVKGLYYLSSENTHA